MSSNVDLGKICLTPAGLYDSAKTYEKLSLVTCVYSDVIESYVSVRDVPVGAAPVRGSVSDYWQVIGCGVDSVSDIAAVVADLVKDDIACPCSQRADRTITIGSFVPASASVYINGIQRSSGDTFVVKDGDVLCISALADGYENYVAFETVSEDTEITGTMTAKQQPSGVGGVYCIDIGTISPSDAAVTIDGEAVTRKFVAYGDDVTIVASKSGYDSKTVTLSDVAENHVVDITLRVHDSYTLSVAKTGGVSASNITYRWKGEALSGQTFAVTSTNDGTPVTWTIDNLQSLPAWVHISNVASDGFTLALDACTVEPRHATIDIYQSSSNKWAHVEVYQYTGDVYYKNSEFEFYDGSTKVSNSYITLGTAPKNLTLISKADSYNIASDTLVASGVAAPWKMSLATGESAPEGFTYPTSGDGGEETYTITYQQGSASYSDGILRFIQLIGEESKMRTLRCRVREQ